ncbi:hypothetical protein Holit_02863 [Hollandina sp. SP2]
MLRKATGNMYDWVTHTWNPVKGKCFHNCSYCYMKRWGDQKAVRLDEQELKTDLGTGNFIFVGSSCDLFADENPETWIVEALEKANRYKNQYLVQTKNPNRFHRFLDYLPADQFILGTTIETNRVYEKISGQAPSIVSRVVAMCRLPQQYQDKKIITVEPIMDFDINDMVMDILSCNPFQVNIGADSGNNHLPEPSPEKIASLIEALRPYTKIHLKKNLKRLYKDAAQ